MKENTSKLQKVDLNNYTRPPKVNNTLYFGSKYILNSRAGVGRGQNNSYFEYIESLYYGSTTNANVIDNFVNLIMGEGLVDQFGNELDDFIDYDDLLKYIRDYYIQGNACLQIVYQNDLKTVNNMFYVPVKNIGINNTPTVTFQVDSYWYSWDWNNLGRYTPKLIHAFGVPYNVDENLQPIGMTGEELLYTRNPDNQNFFSLPTWESCTEDCEVQEEISHYAKQHIKNGLSSGHMFNVVKGHEATDEDKLISMRSIQDGLTGSDNAGNQFISYNTSQEDKTTIEAIPVSDAHKQYEIIRTATIDSILQAHKVSNAILFGINKPSGFGNNAEERIDSLKQQYRSVINPVRKVILRSLQKVFTKIDSTIKISFKDFAELSVESGTGIVTDDIQLSKDSDDDLLDQIIELATSSKIKKKAKKSAAAKAKLKGKPKPPFHDNCRCVLTDGKITSADPCDYCQEIIKEHY